MPAFSTYAIASGNRDRDIAYIASNILRAYPSHTQRQAEAVARQEIDDLEAEMAVAPPLAEAERLEAAAKLVRDRFPRCKVSQDAHDEARRMRMAAKCRDRLKAAPIGITHRQGELDHAG